VLQLEPCYVLTVLGGVYRMAAARLCNASCLPRNM